MSLAFCTPIKKLFTKKTLHNNAFFAGHDYGHQTLNPLNQCQWCDLDNATDRANSAWSNRPGVRCDDADNCTKQDSCKDGRYTFVSRKVVIQKGKSVRNIAERY